MPHLNYIVLFLSVTALILLYRNQFKAPVIAFTGVYLILYYYEVDPPDVLLLAVLTFIIVNDITKQRPSAKSHTLETDKQMGTLKDNEMAYATINKKTVLYYQYTGSEESLTRLRLTFRNLGMTITKIQSDGKALNISHEGERTILKATHYLVHYPSGFVCTMSGNHFRRLFTKIK